ncbi:MAG: hypothetical protein F6J87_08455 [Spirulina sp. SIO3F2]|nr:hypothetical protein [Spirulina sp. SIO3F2]
MAKTNPRRFELKAFFNMKTALIVLILLLITWFGAAFVMDQKQIFVPGETSKGHHLFEASCKSCHEGFKPVSNDNCNRCHEAELAEDKHGVKKFRDPRWGEYLEEVDVLTCTACHNEHVHMFGRGVHLHPDLCMGCHEGIINGDLASHDGFTRDGCWTAGCHNFHDHRASSTAFLAAGLDQPFMLPQPELPELAIAPSQDRVPKADLAEEFLGGGA